MKFGLRIPSFALGPRTASLQEMGAYLRRAEDLGFDCAVTRSEERRVGKECRL